MSWFTVFARHVGLGPVLDAIEAGEAAVKAATPEGAQQAVATATGAVKAVLPEMATIAVSDLGGLAGQVVDEVAKKMLPPTALSLENTVVGNILSEVEAAASKWLGQQFAG